MNRDSEDVRQGKGFGYRVLLGERAGRVCMIRCFKCGRENWAMAVASGQCAWCGYDANGEENHGADQKGK